MKVIFSETAFSQYVGWLSEDKKTTKRINDIIKDIQRNGFMSGIGKPEPLKGRNAYSRRIDKHNRLVYTGNSEQDLEIISCKGHYEN